MHPSPTSIRGIVIYDGTPRMEWQSADTIWLQTCRQAGQIPIEIEVWDSEPEDTDEAWDEAQDISFLAADEVNVTGWDEAWSSQTVPLERGSWYRMRYSLAETGRASSVWEAPYPEKYRLQFWKAEPSLAEVVR
jgi:hypothetical protein